MKMKACVPAIYAIQHIEKRIELYEEDLAKVSAEKKKIDESVLHDPYSDQKLAALEATKHHLELQVAASVANKRLISHAIYDVDIEIEE